jgi:hypothetical protein
VVDSAFVIRVGPSGPDMPQGTPGFVLTVQPDGLSVKPEPAGGGGGSITPFTNVVTVDDSSTAVSPDGAWSQAQAFPNLQDGITALGTFGGTVYLAGGEYSSNVTIDGEAVQVVEIIGLPLRQLGSSSKSPLISGDIIGAGTDSNPFCVLRRLTVTGAITGDGGEWQFFEVSAGSVSSVGEMVARDSDFGPVTAIACDAQDSQFTQTLTVAAPNNFQNCVFSGVVTASVLNATNSRFDANVTINASGTSKVSGCAFNQDVLFDQCDAFNSTFSGDVTGDTGGGMAFRSCLLTGTVGNPVSWDGETELRSLKAGLVFDGTFVVALEVGQLGDADIITGTGTLNWNGRTRGIVAATGLSGATNLTFDLAGSTPLATYVLDVYNTTANAINLLFGVTNIGPGGVALPTQAAGTGTRYMVQVDTLGTSITCIGSKAI